MTEFLPWVGILLTCLTFVWHAAVNFTLARDTRDTTKILSKQIQVNYDRTSEQISEITKVVHELTINVAIHENRLENIEFMAKMKK